MEIDKGFTEEEYSDGEWVYIPIGFTPEEIDAYTKTIECAGWRSYSSKVETLRWWIHEIIYERIVDLGYNDPANEEEEE